MLGKRSQQRGMFEADHLYLDFVGPDTFYGFFGQTPDGTLSGRRLCHALLPGPSVAGLVSHPASWPLPCCCPGQDLRQAHDRVSDAEAKRRADFDLCWKVALGIELKERLFAKSTLQLFRAQLILHEQAGAIFKRSLDLRCPGYRLPEGTQDEGGAGYDFHLGPRGGEGHLQHAGGWDQEALVRIFD